MEKCLLIGNGLNRTLSNSISWSDLLKDISVDLGTNYFEDIPLPLEFERIVNMHLECHVSPTPEFYSTIKKSVIEKIKYTKLPSNAIHKKLIDIKFDAILTTNYDYLLEYVFDEDYKHCGETNKKYLFECTSTQKGIKFYHLHGMTSSAHSICLGYEHYVGIVEKLRTELNSKKNNEADKMRIKQILYEEAERKNTWGEKFYTSNIDIVGFGLSNCEIDIWWLITHRAYLFYSNYCGLKEKIENKIIFYDVVEDRKCSAEAEERMRLKKESEQKQKHNLLQNNHVIVKQYPLSKYGDYTSAYVQIISDIKKGE